LLLLACVIGAIMTAAGGGGSATATPQAAASNPTPVGTSVAAGNPTAANTTIAAAAVQATATVAPKAAPTEKPAAPTATPKPPPTATPTPAPPPGLNQIVSVKNWDLAVAAVERPGKELVWSQYGNKSAAAGTWFIVALDMKNTGNTNFGVNTSDFELNAAGGIKYNVSSDLGSYGYAETKGGQRVGGQVPPGVSVRYYVIFDIAPDATGLTFKFKQDKNPIFTVGNAAP
jgi:ABC-type Na+ efflux pump permease subunit